MQKQRLGGQFALMVLELFSIRNHPHQTLPICTARQGRDLPTSQLDSFLGECVRSYCRLRCRTRLNLHQRRVTVGGKDA